MMIRLKDAPLPSTHAALRQAIDIAEYYGFTRLDAIPRAKDTARAPATQNRPEDRVMFARRDERALPSVVRKCLGRVRSPYDMLLAWRVAEAQVAIPTTSLELHVMGTSSVIAEAMLIIVGYTIARALGDRDHVVLINNFGSPESCSRFARDVGTYLRKHIESISPTLRPRAAIDPIGTLVTMIERGHPAVLRAPQAMEYLTEDERSRFWQLLEYLEAFGLPYELSGHILGSRDCWSHALYEIAQVDAESGARVPVAFGGRYDPLVSRIASAPRAGTMISITYERRGPVKTQSVNRSPHPQATPAIYFTHLGDAARKHSLGILESLRKAEIPVHQNLWRDRISDQMEHARTLGTPYILIFGHKEATEGTIIVREVATNSQSAIPLGDLVSYLKRHRIMSRTSVGG